MKPPRIGICAKVRNVFDEPALNAFDCYNVFNGIHVWRPDNRVVLFQQWYCGSYACISLTVNNIGNVHFYFSRTTFLRT